MKKTTHLVNGSQEIRELKMVPRSSEA